VLSADDYIAMRANAHRAKWLTLVIFLVLLGVVSYLVVRAADAQGYALVSTNGAVVLVGFLFVMIVSCLVKAYQKVPFSMAFGLADDAGDFGDCDGD